MPIISPKKIIRTTLADRIPDAVGVYIIAYLGKILYVGKAEHSVNDRINNHRNNALKEQLGSWMIRCDDWPNIRLDVLVAPDLVDLRTWTKLVEAACIRKFSPLFNIALQA